MSFVRLLFSTASSHINCSLTRSCVYVQQDDEELTLEAKSDETEAVVCNTKDTTEVNVCY